MFQNSLIQSPQNLWETVEKWGLRISKIFFTIPLIPELPRHMKRKNEHYHALIPRHLFSLKMLQKSDGNYFLEIFYIGSVDSRK